MSRRLNNKGYMLVEIILAFVIAMGITYFMFELIIKLKNKNDDLIVKTLVSTDQAIIYNTIMRNLSSVDSFSCDYIKVENNIVKYNNKIINEISEYAEVSDVVCSVSANEVKINIPINVKQLNESFNVNIEYNMTNVGGSLPETPSAPSSASSSLSPLLPFPSSSSSSMIPLLPTVPSSSSNIFTS